MFPGPHFAIQISYLNASNPPFLLLCQTNFQIPEAVCHNATYSMIINTQCFVLGLLSLYYPHCPDFLLSPGELPEWLQPSFCILLYVLLFLCRSQYNVVVKTKDSRARYLSLPLMCPSGYDLTSRCLSFPIYKQSLPHSSGIMIKWGNTKNALSKAWHR